MPVFCGLSWVLLQKVLTKAKKQTNSPRNPRYAEPFWAGGIISGSCELFTQNLLVWIVQSSVSLQPDTVRSSVHGVCLGLICFSSEKWPSCFREQGWEQMTLLHPCCEQDKGFHGTTCGLEDKLQGDRRGGREAPLLTAGELPPPAGWTCTQKKSSVRRAWRCLGRVQKPPFPGGLSEHSQDLHPVLGKEQRGPSSHWASLFTTRWTPSHTCCMHYIHMRSSNLSHSALDYSLHCFPMSSLGQCNSETWQKSVYRTNCVRYKQPVLLHSCQFLQPLSWVILIHALSELPVTAEGIA